MVKRDVSRRDSPFESGRSLEQILVVQACRTMAGAYAGRAMRQIGLTVVVAEINEDVCQSVWYKLLNSGKEILVLTNDTSTSDRLRKVCAKADVFLTDWDGSELIELGLGDDELSQLNPGLVYCQMPSGCSITGRPTGLEDELILGATSGLYASQYSRRGGPVHVVPPVMSFGAGTLAAAASLAALVNRSVTGHAPRVVVPRLSGAFAMQSAQLNMLAGRTELVGSDPQGSRPAYHAYHCADDRWIFVACVHPAFWAKFCVAIGEEGLLADPRLVDAPVSIPTELWPEIGARLDAIFATKPSDAWIAILQGADVPCQPILGLSEILLTEQARVNDLTVDVDVSDVIASGRPIRVDGQRVELESGLTPMNNEHLERTKPTGRSRGSSGPIPSIGRPLDGIKVLDMSTFMAAAGAATVAASFGATVIKVEPVTGDPLRQHGLTFFSVNGTKRPVAINLKTADGLQVLKRLISEVDVLVENFRPGLRDRIGLTREMLRAINPVLVHCSVSAYGSRGPLSHLPGVDPMAQALSGMMTSQGGTDNPPVLLETVPVDNGTYLNAGFGVMAGLLLRQITGAGCFVETSLLNTALELQLPLNDRAIYPLSVVAGHVQERVGTGALHRLYRTGTGDWVALAADATDWLRLQAVLGLPPSLDEEEVVHADVGSPVALALERKFLEQPLGSWIERLNKARIPAVAVRSRRDLLNDQAVLTQGLIVKNRCEWGELWTVGQLAFFDGVRYLPPRYPTALGGLTGEVLRDFGWADEEVAMLAQNEAVIVGVSAT